MRLTADISLRRFFFPAHFDRKFFQALQDRTGLWINFWRKTDPIGTPIPGPPGPRDVMIPDPLPNQKLKVHSDYWIADEQIEAIDALILGRPEMPRDRA